MKTESTSTKNPEKVFVFTLIPLLAILSVVHVFDTVIQIRTFASPIGYIYSLWLVILAAGGLAAGYWLPKKSHASLKHQRLFIAIIYAFFAVSFGWLLSIASSVLTPYAAYQSNMFAAFLSIGVPAVAPMATVACAYFLQRKQPSSHVSNATKAITISSFVLCQLCFIMGFALYLGRADENALKWVAIIGYASLSLVLSIVAYAFFDRISSRITRGFYATLVAATYSLISIFGLSCLPRIPRPATFITIAITTAIALLVSCSLAWRVRASIGGKRTAATN